MFSEDIMKKQKAMRKFKKLTITFLLLGLLTVTLTGCGLGYLFHDHNHHHDGRYGRGCGGHGYMHDTYRDSSDFHPHAEQDTTGRSINTEDHNK